MRRFLSTLLAVAFSLALIAGSFFLALTLVGMTPQEFAAKARTLFSASSYGEKLVDAITPSQSAEPLFKITPQDGPSVTAATTSFWFEGERYEVRCDVDARVYAGAVNAKRLYRASATSRASMYEEFARVMVNDPAQSSALDALCEQMRAIKKENDFSSAQYAEFLVKYVQCIPYDDDRASANISSISEAGDPRFPVQVLVDGKGDCDEKTYLLAALLKHEGYGCAALLFSDENHMSLGIKSSGAGYKNTGYEFVETTSPSYISDTDQEYASGVDLVSTPMVLKIADGAAYSKKALAQIQAIIKARESAMDAAPIAKKRAEAAKTRGEFEAYKAQYEACYEARNTLQLTKNESGLLVKEFKDRRLAYKWVKTYAWWSTI